MGLESRDRQPTERRLLRPGDLHSLSHQVSEALFGSLRVLNEVGMDDSDEAVEIAAQAYLDAQTAKLLEALRDHVRDIHWGFALQLRLGEIDSSRLDVRRVLALMPKIDVVDPMGEFLAQLSSPTPAFPVVVERPGLSEAYRLFHTALGKLRAHQGLVTLADLNDRTLGGFPHSRIPLSWRGPLHPEAEFDVIGQMGSVTQQVLSGGPRTYVSVSPSLSHGLLRTAQLLAVEQDILSV
jgi:hypothetical protein